MKITRRPGWMDKRITRSYFSISAYLFLLVSLFVLSILPAVFYGGWNTIVRDSGPYLWWYILYWVIVATGITVLIGVQRYVKFERPVRKLSGAAKQVAEGDFSVYLSPPHRQDRMDYLDTLFVDFNRMVEELGSTETLKNDFVANVSHELKTPLAVIQNYAQLLQNPALTQEVREEYIGSILDSTRRLSNLITNILRLNKLESQKILPRPAPYDLCRQLTECALGFEQIWEREGIEFEADIEDRVTVEADESLMELVWNNLLSNAFKFTERGGRVKLTQTSEPDLVTVKVCDTGCGMPPGTIKHVFDKFYQGDTSHATEGNGLGLALVLRILEIGGASVTVDSQVGCGTVFTVLIPAGNMDKESVSYE